MLLSKLCYVLLRNFYDIYRDPDFISFLIKTYFYCVKIGFLKMQIKLLVVSLILLRKNYDSHCSKHKSCGEAANFILRLKSCFIYQLIQSAD